MIINHNIAALNTYNKFGAANKAKSGSMEKLSSGLRINRAGDDAAGLAISEKMRGQIRGLDMGAKNAQDGISLIQTAEGALNETHSILQRMRELSVQAANDTNTADDRTEIQKEISQLTEEIDRIGNTTEFNTKKLINGGASVSGSVTYANAGEAGSITVTGGTGDTKVGTTLNVTGTTVATAATVDNGGTHALKTTTLGAASEITLNGTKFSFTANDTVQDVLNAVNDASIGIKASHTNGGAITFTATEVGSAAGINITGTSTGAFGIAASGTLAGGTTNGTDATITGAGMYKAEGNSITILNGDAKGLELKISGAVTGANTITVDENGTLNLQIGANEGQEVNISIKDMRASALGVNSIDATTQTSASSAITTIDKAIASVSGERSKLGAYQNRLDHTINNLGTSSENLTAAESRIRDVDMAKEMMDQTKNSILSQAAQAMLAQANQQPQQVLQLLQ